VNLALGRTGERYVVSDGGDRAAFHDDLEAAIADLDARYAAMECDQ
jgi:hypothetical protein